MSGDKFDTKLQICFVLNKEVTPNKKYNDVLNKIRNIGNYGIIRCFSEADVSTGWIFLPLYFYHKYLCRYLFD